MVTETDIIKCLNRYIQEWFKDSHVARLLSREFNRSVSVEEVEPFLEKMRNQGKLEVRIRHREKFYKNREFNPGRPPG